MKKIFISLLIIMFLIGCINQGNEANMTTSKIYSSKDIEDAIQVVQTYCEENFHGCTLIEVSYVGDAYEEEFEKYALKYDGDEAIILYSTFETDEYGGDGSLEPNMIYEDFNWILVRNKNGKWIHKDHGY